MKTTNGLIVSRMEDESIRIGDDIVVKVIDIRGSTVRLAIKAPPNVSVHREEVYRAIQNAATAEQLKVKP